LDIQSFLCIQARTSSGTILRDREAFSDFTEVTHKIEYQCGTMVSTSAGSWTSVSCKEVNSPEKQSIFHYFILQGRAKGAEEAKEEEMSLR